MLAVEGVSKFVPASVKHAALGLRAAHAEIRAALTAPAVTHPARISGRYLRWRIGQYTHATTYATHALRRYRNAIEGMTIDHPAILDLADALEDPEGTGKMLPAWLQPWGRIREQVFDYLEKQQDDLGVGLEWREYYLKNIWQKEFEGKTLTGRAKARLVGSRTLRGPATYRKHKTIQTMREGVEQFGKEPTDWNLVDRDLYAMEEMAKFTFGVQVREDNKRLGTWVFGTALKRKPEGLEPIPDPLGEVYAPPRMTVREAYDKLLTEGLETFIRSLGVKYERRVTTGKAWGKTGEETGAIKVKFGAPETVLMHEIGHALNARFGLYERIATAVKTPQFEGEKSALHELRDLAKLRYEGQEPTERFKHYVQSHDEQIANLVHAYLYAPEKARQVAPTAYDALEDLIATTPELSQLADLQQMRSLVFGQREATYKLPGPILLGRYYAQPEVARMFTNYLKPGLGAHRAWALLRVPSNLMVQAKLGFSWFHAFTVTQESAAMEAARGITAIIRGHPKAGIGRVGAAVIEPVAVVARGLETQKKYLSTLDPLTLAATDAVNLLLMGGGRIQMSRQYTNRSLSPFLDNLRRANTAYLRQNYGRAGTEAMAAAFRVLPAAIEAAAYPILQWLVPAAKVGTTISQIRSELEALPGEPTEETLLAVASKAVNITDATLGEVIWDNYFLPRAFMNVVHMLIMAPGWRWGSAILLARGLTDPFRRLLPGQRETYTVRVPAVGGPGKAPPPGPRPGVTPEAEPSPPGWKTAEVKEPYWSPYTSLVIATVFVGALIAEIYQLAHGAGHIESPRDAALPRTGEVDSSGKPERVRHPGYTSIFYDILRRPPWSVFEYALGGQAPMPTAIGQWWNNETRFGEEIVDPADPGMVKLWDYAKFLAKQWEPISVSSYGRRAGTTIEKAESVLGISPAARRMTESNAERLMREYLGPSHRTKEQAAQGDVATQLSEATREGDTAKIAQLRSSGQISRKAADQAARQALVPALVRRFRELPIGRALKVYEAETPEERSILRPYLERKFETAFEQETIPGVEQLGIIARMQRARLLPTGKR